MIGVIAPTTRPYCDRCRRMPVTPHGALVPCLHNDRRYDILPYWNGRTLDTPDADALLRPARTPSGIDAACELPAAGDDSNPHDDPSGPMIPPVTTLRSVRHRPHSDEPCLYPQLERYSSFDGSLFDGL